MPTYAIISNGIVQNKVLADSVADFPESIEAQLIADDAVVDIGWAFSEGIFTAPPPVPVDPATAALDARKRRNDILVNTVDPYVMNALRWADLSVEQQGEIAAYRRALLDITDQPRFPLDIVWPEQPTFM